MNLKKYLGFSYNKNEQFVGDEEYHDGPKPKKARAKKEKKEDSPDETPIETVESKFKVGDIIVVIDSKQGKLPWEAFDFLNAYKEYTVEEVKENGKLNLGCKVCHNEDGKEKDFLFNPKRFDFKK